VYAFRVSEQIAAPPARVWRALCDPAEVVAWDTGVAEALDAPPDYPQPGQHVRWRFRHGWFRILHDRPLEVRSERTLRAALSVGPYRFDETYTLATLPDGCRLTADLVVRVAVPVVGGIVARRWIGPRLRSGVMDSLARLRQWCEPRP
jgi:hypothetical protein